MSRWRRRVDSNQTAIIEMLRSIPGVTVAPRHDDILCGYRGLTFWYEIKNPDAISKKGKVQNLKPSQQKLLDTWQGHFKIVSSFQEIWDDMQKEAI